MIKDKGLLILLCEAGLRCEVRVSEKAGPILLCEAALRCAARDNHLSIIIAKVAEGLNFRARSPARINAL